MRYLLFNWEETEEEIDDLTKITDKRFEELAEKCGQIYEDNEDFQSAFNSEEFSVYTHQLRIVADSISA